jgi:hypothetical protein
MSRWRLGADNKPHNKPRIKSILSDTNTDYSANRFRLEFILFDIASEKEKRRRRRIMARESEQEKFPSIRHR